MAPTTCKGFSAASAARNLAPAESWAGGGRLIGREVYGCEPIFTTVRPVTLPSRYAWNAPGSSVNGIVRRLESSGETEVPTGMIGEAVMDALASLDKVAYVRFASVYRNFREAKDFETFVGKIGGGEHD